MRAPELATGHPVPVIAIDGPTASGKGTVARRIADRLGWHYLDSGALYRVAGVMALHAGVDLSDPQAVVGLLEGVAPRFEGERVRVGELDLTERIRDEDAGMAASKVAALEPVRAALLAWQRQARRAPGLVADGRDMGTRLFPDAALKVFLTASAHERAVRRHKQLIEKGISANFADLLKDLEERDARDMSRAASPLVPAEGALLLDSSGLTVDETVERVMQQWYSVVAVDRADRAYGGA